jgi:hypothetical protein
LDGDTARAADFLRKAETNAGIVEAHLANLKTLAERAAAPGRLEFE